MPPIRVRLDADRWHFQHGPIDVVIGADGDPAAVAESHEAAWWRFRCVLDELVAELPLLRRAVDPAAAGAGGERACPLHGAVAARMWQACRPFAAAGFITPMAAVAGGVADALIVPYRRPGVRRAWVNNGGDIALHLAEGESLRVGVIAGAGDPRRPLRVAADGRLSTDGRFEVHAALPVRGVATSGWRGRSFSLGIADSVTVLARSGAEADAAATVIANAVDLPGDPRIGRRPACELKDDSDLGAIPVTVDVPPLPAAAVRAALLAGRRQAEALRERGLIRQAVLVCQTMVATTTAGDSALDAVGSAAGAERAAGAGAASAASGAVRWPLPDDRIAPARADPAPLMAGASRRPPRPPQNRSAGSSLA